MRTQSPFACVMDVIDLEKREPHIANARALFKHVLKIVEINDGYAFSFSNDDKLKHI